MAAKEFDRGSTQGMASLIPLFLHTSEPEGGGLGAPPASMVTVGMWRPWEQHAGSRADLSASCLFCSARLGLDRGQQDGGWLEGTRLYSLALLHPCPQFTEGN